MDGAATQRNCRKSETDNPRRRNFMDDGQGEVITRRLGGRSLYVTRNMLHPPAWRSPSLLIAGHLNCSLGAPTALHSICLSQSHNHLLSFDINVSGCS